MVGKGKKGYHNVVPKDKVVHSQSARGMKQPQRINMIDKFVEANRPKKILSARQITNRKYERAIIDSIDSEGYDENPITDKEKLQFLKDTFRAEYGWAIERMGEQKAFSEWISGLPSSFSIPFMNRDILELAKVMGSLPEDATEKQEDRVLENYWNFMTVKTFQSFRKYKIR